MNIKNLTIQLAPTRVEYEALTDSLRENGFCNGKLQPHDYSRICESFDNHHFIVLHYNHTPIGFTTWRGELQWAIVDYKWILPEYRGMGFGRRFSELIYEEFIRRNIFYVLVQPATDYGWGMSRSFGFAPLSESDYRFDTSYQYLFLRPNREYNSDKDIGYELLIWHNWNDQTDPCQIYRLDDTMKSSPIISIVDSDAHVELRKDGKTIKKCNAKRIFEKNELQSYGLLFFNKNLSDWLTELDIKQ